jgi:hypothetical protein
MSDLLSLRNLLAVSLGLHISALGMFGFSFPPVVLPPANRMVFLGNILPQKALFPAAVTRDNSCSGRPSAQLSLPVALLARPGESPAPYVRESAKPAVTMERPMPGFPALAAAGEKPPQGAASVLTFHPLLPYGLQLYFKDREAVHIELEFNIVSENGKDYIVVKRKISSGNLDADLLCSRYISHYLFIQRLGFAANKWQSVKIDLSKQRGGD